MIESLRLRNLKSFRDTGPIPLRPITVLAGANSVGKSSVLQALLLLKQTFEAEGSDAPLALDGRYLQLSELSDLAFQKPSIATAEVEYELRVSGSMGAQDVRPFFSRWPQYQTRAWAPYQSTLRWMYRSVSDDPGRRRIAVGSFSEDTEAFGLEGGIDARWMPRAKRYDAALRDLQLPPEYRDRAIVNVNFRHFLPDHLTLGAVEGKTGRHAATTIGLPFPINQPMSDLRDLIQHQLHYLGPLRERPRRAYLHLGSTRPEIGQRGEYAAQVLWLERDDIVQYRPVPDGSIEELRFLEAVNDAFARMGFGQRIHVRSDRSVTYQLLFDIPGKGSKNVTIADVGFGVSQLLPVIVLTLRSGPSSLLLFEQPEIHLHPRLQANLADFFIAASSSEKRFVIETHSDHFINRLRRRIAEDPTDELSDRIAIHFVQSADDGARIEPLAIDRYGVITNWPPDFLPESADEAEAIVRAGIEKRRS